MIYLKNLLNVNFTLIFDASIDDSTQSNLF